MSQISVKWFRVIIRSTQLLDRSNLCNHQLFVNMDNLMNKYQILPFLNLFYR